MKWMVLMWVLIEVAACRHRAQYCRPIGQQIVCVDQIGLPAGGGGR